MHESTRSSRPRAFRFIDFLLARDNHSFLLHAAFVLFFALSLLQSLYHAPWRDEGQAWLMARDLTPWGLFLESRHDGHPILWHLCLKALQSVGIGYIGMMLLNWVFINGAVWLLFYRSHLPLLARLAFAFCPSCLLYVCYYGRDYAISVFLLFLAALAYRDVPRRPIVFTSLLALAANTNLYATAVFAGASFQFLLEQVYSLGRGPFSLRPLYTRYALPNAVLIVGALLVLLQLTPIPSLFDPPRPEPMPASLSAESAMSVPAWEKFALRVEHAAIFNYNPHLWLFLLIFPALLLFRKSPGSPRIYGTAVTWLIALVPITFNPAGSRHLFVLVAGAFYFLWLYYDDFVPATDSREESRPPSPALNLAGWVTFFLVALCWRCQQEDLHSALVPMSDAPAAARALIDHHLDTPNTVVVTADPSRFTAVLMLLDHIHVDYRPPPFPAKPDSFGDFYYYRQRKSVPTVAGLKSLALEVARAHPSKTILVVTSDPVDKPALSSDPDYLLSPVYLSPDLPVYSDESFQIYQLQKSFPSSP